MQFIQHVKKTFSLDYRSLALYRMLMGLIIMLDVALRIPDIIDFYTDAGLIPRSIFLNEMAMPWSFSLHLANGTPGFAYLMFGLQFLVGLFLFIGFKTRFMMLAAYIFTVSVHNRNWTVNNGGDDILRSIFFISIFLPLNRALSFDSALRKEEENYEKLHFSTWGLMFFLQVFVIYFIGWVLKDHPIWRTEFTAVALSSRLDIFATGLGVWLRDYPSLTKLSTFFTIYLEFLGPMILVFSFLLGKYWWISRVVLIGLFWGLHLGIFATMNIGIFPFLCMFMWIIFVPPQVWEKLKGPNNFKIFYDGECGFCEKMAKLLRSFFLNKDVPIQTTQSDKSCHELMLKENSWVLEDSEGKRCTHFHAFIVLSKSSQFLKFFVPVFKLFLPVGNAIYRWIAGHRRLMGVFSQFFEFTSPRKTNLFFKSIYQLLGVFFFMTLLFWNLTTVRRWEVSAPFWQTIGRWTHLYQEWNMFAPYPKTDNVWIEVPATLSDGSTIELITGSRDIYSIKDQEFVKAVPNEHWRKFYLNVSDRVDYARYFGGYLCRKYNERKIDIIPGTQLRILEVIAYSQVNGPDGSRGGINKKLSWKHWCFDEDYKRDNPSKK